MKSIMKKKKFVNKFVKKDYFIIKLQKIVVKNVKLVNYLIKKKKNVKQ